MTWQEWLRIVVEIQARWPNREIADEVIEIWYSDLSDLEAEQVRSAMLSLYRDGREWAPNGAQIRERVSELARDAKDHGAAYALACRAASSKGYERGLEWLREQDELVAIAAERFPWRSFCLDAMEAGVHRAQFRDIYRAVAEDARREAAYAGLNPAGLRSLERRPRSMREALGRALPEGQNLVELEAADDEESE